MRNKISKTNLARYDFLSYCGNVLIDILNYANTHNFTETKIPFRTIKDEKTYFALNNDDEKSITWLIDNGYEETVYEAYYKPTFFSLISDFLDFYSVSIEQALAQNIVVAWSLLRRPMQEDLAYIEWLYLEKYELIKRMISSNDVKNYDLVWNKKLRERIVKEVYKDIKSDNFDVYSFRYSKEKDYSINGILNGAMHLITTRNKNFITTPSTLNFVFKDGIDMEKCINMYFTAIPFLMYYTMTTIMKTFSGIADLKPYTILMNEYNFRLKNLKALQTMSLEDGIKIAQIEEPIYCPKCGNKFETLDDWQAYAYKSVKCNQCGNVINTFGYIFDFEEINFKVR